MVLVDSSAARMPLPGATIACATLLSSARFILRLPASMILAVPTNPVPADSLPFITLKTGREGRPPQPFRQFFAGCSALQHFDTRQRLAFHPFEKRAARGRDVAEFRGDAGLIEGGHQ